MKIDMTEDEAMRGFFKNWLGEREEGVRFFRTVMNLLGLEFKPEGPELPERVEVMGDGFHVTLSIPGVKEGSAPIVRDGPAWTAVYREAAARYNAVGRFLAVPRPSLSLTPTEKALRGMLTEERERLR